MVKSEIKLEKHAWLFVKTCCQIESTTYLNVHVSRDFLYNLWCDCDDKDLKAWIFKFFATGYILLFLILNSFCNGKSNIYIWATFLPHV